MAVSKALIAFFLLCLLAPLPAEAKKHETGFIDRTTTIQATQYKYQVFVPEDWTPHRKWPVILALHGSGERGSDGILQTDVGIGVAIRTDRSEITLPTASVRYTLSASNLQSASVMLNGRALKLASNDDLPEINGRATAAGLMHFAPATITFVAIPEAANAACAAVRG